jgi:hypothetical protein
MFADVGGGERLNVGIWFPWRVENVDSMLTGTLGLLGGGQKVYGGGVM